MAVFQSKKFVSSSQAGTNAQRIRAAVARHPFMFFGLPFMATMLAGSFFLTPATALRYERHDRKVKQLSQEEGLGIGKEKRKVDLKEEYYVSLSIFTGQHCQTDNLLQRLAAKDLDNWEQKRVKRLPGEIDGILE